MMVENARTLFEDQKIRNDDTDNYIEVLVPTSFNFPNIGKLLTLLFVLFAGWFVGKSNALSDYPGVAVLGLFTLFGGVDLALPFLLDQMQIPSDMYQLYVVTGVVNSWFATLLAVMNLFTFTLVAACAATGAVRINWSRILSFAIISLLVFGAALLGTRFLLSEMISKEDIQRRTLMQSEVKKGPQTADTEKGDSKEVTIEKSHLETILKRGKLRVGAFVISTEAGSAWTIIYPSYSVVVPEPHIKAHAGLAMPLGDSDFADVVDDWPELKKTSGFISKLYDKWILGKSEVQKKPRWSIIRDVLHWVDQHEGSEIK